MRLIKQNPQLAILVISMALSTTVIPWLIYRYAGHAMRWIGIKHYAMSTASWWLIAAICFLILRAAVRKVAKLVWFVKIIKHS